MALNVAEVNILLVLWYSAHEILKQFKQPTARQ